MDMKLLGTFVLFNVLNVIIQTVKSIITMKGTKEMAALVNAVAYGLYTYIIILTACDLPVFAKATIVGLCNLIGVYIVKYGEERLRKDKLWEVRATIPATNAPKVMDMLNTKDIQYSYIDIKKYLIFNIYCINQKESAIVRNILDLFDAKYFVSESKSL